MTDQNQDLLACSFCGKTAADGVRLVCGPAVYICSECIDLSGEILANEIPWRTSTDETAAETWATVPQHARDAVLEALGDKRERYIAAYQRWKAHGRTALCEDSEPLIDAVGAAIDILTESTDD